MFDNSDNIINQIESDLYELDINPVKLSFYLKSINRSMGVDYSKRISKLTYTIEIKYFINYLIYDLPSSGKSLFGLLADETNGYDTRSNNLKEYYTSPVLAENSGYVFSVWYVSDKHIDFEYKLKSLENTIIIVDEEAVDFSDYIRQHLFKKVPKEGYGNRKKWVETDLYHQLRKKNNKFIIINRDPFPMTLRNTEQSSIKAICNRKYSYCHLLNMDIKDVVVSDNRTRSITISSVSTDIDITVQEVSSLPTVSFTDMTSTTSKSLDIFIKNNLLENKDPIPSSVTITEDSNSISTWFDKYFNQGHLSMYGIVNLREVYKTISGNDYKDNISILIDSIGTYIFGSQVGLFKNLKNVSISPITSMEGVILSSLDVDYYTDIALYIRKAVTRLFNSDVYDKEGMLVDWLNLLCIKYHNLDYSKKHVPINSIKVNKVLFRRNLGIEDDKKVLSSSYIKSVESECDNQMQLEGWDDRKDDYYQELFKRTLTTVLIQCK